MAMCSLNNTWPDSAAARTRFPFPVPPGLPLPRCRLLPSLPPSLLPAGPHQRGVDQRVGQGCEPVGDGGAVLLDPGGTPALP